MTAVRCLVVLLAIIGAGPTLALAWQTPGAPTPPPRDPRAKPAATGTIKGRVTSSDGRPLRRAQVRATPADQGASRTTSTDTDGHYEVSDLTAGRYRISVTRSGYVSLGYGQRYPGELGVPVSVGAGETADRIDIALPRAGVIAGRVVDEVGDPIAGVTLHAMQLRYFQGRRQVVPVQMNHRSDDTGQYRIFGLTPGDYFVMASLREAWVVVGKDKEKTEMAFAPTYYPGTPSLTTAQRVKVGLAQEVQGIDFPLATGRTASVKGVVLAANGAPSPGASVSLSQEFRGPGGASVMGVGGTTARPDGTFSIPNVSPGEYKITARGPASGSRDMTSQMITIDGSDLDGLTLVAGVGGIVSGQIIVDSQQPFPTALSRMRVIARSVDGVVSVLAIAGSSNGAVSDAGRFEISDLGGSQRLSLVNVPSDWVVKSMSYEDVDLADLDLTMRPGERYDGVRIVLTDRIATVKGAVAVDRDDQNGTGTVVVFRQEPALWVDQSRHVRAVRPSQRGEFELNGLLAGDYYAIAADFLPEGDWFDPEVLKSLVERAERFTLDEAGTKTLKLRLRR